MSCQTLNWMNYSQDFKDDKGSSWVENHHMENRMPSGNSCNIHDDAVILGSHANDGTIQYTGSGRLFYFWTG